jgi:transcriptional regulator with XRE-family HTH domain
MAKKKSAKEERQELLLSYGSHLRKLRERKGLSGEELGAKVGMTRQAISRLEVGSANPSLVVINKLCKGLGITVETFFKGFK